MSEYDNFLPRPTMDDFVNNIDPVAINTIDKSDIFWCFSSEGIASLVTENPGMLFSSIENAIANFFVNVLIKMAKKKECKECIEYIINEKPTYCETPIVVFDLLMKEYVWQMGKICYKQRSNIIPTIRGMLTGLFTSRSGWQEFENSYNKAFVNVYKELNGFSYVVLTNLLEPHKVITSSEYRHLINTFVTKSHVQFENIIAPEGHLFEGESFIDIIMLHREGASIYYKKKYNKYSLLSQGFTGDYPNNFYQRSSPIGNEEIYTL